MYKAAWRSPSNIAIIKYWGKYSEQLPTNPSLSFTLSESYTETTVELNKTGLNSANFQLEFYFDNVRNSQFEKRIQNYLSSIKSLLRFISNYQITIRSQNSFPHSTGLASSASAFSALALCLNELEKKIAGNGILNDAFYKASSNLARLGSGSACRSIYGGWVSWGRSDLIHDSSDSYAVPIQDYIHDEFKGISDSILIVSNESKKVKSSDGHKLMTSNPFAESKYKEAKKNFNLLLEILKTGDWESFIEIMEFEALAIHAMMLSSKPGYFLINGATISIINEIRKFRGAMKIPVGFSLDAGPNVHLIYPQKFDYEIKKWIEHGLLKHCKNELVIHDNIGVGPKKLNIHEFSS